MNPTNLLKAILYIFASVAVAPCGAETTESRAITATEYRLRVENPDALRFQGGALYRPLPDAVKGKATGTHLADLPFATQIEDAAREADLDPALVHAVVFVESRYNPTARSPKGAMGLMQLMPETAERYGVSMTAHSLSANLRAGARYLSDLIKIFQNRLDLALAAYNAGENAVIRVGMRIPPYRETRAYVPAVLTRYEELKEPIPPAGPMPGGVTYLPGTRLNSLSPISAEAGTD